MPTDEQRKQVSRAEVQGRGRFLTVAGKRFVCECGCNVFTVSKTNKRLYTCNACRNEYEGEGAADAD